MNWKTLSIPAFFIFLHTAEVLYPNRKMKVGNWRFYQNLGLVFIWILLVLFFIEQPILIWGHELLHKQINFFHFLSQYFIIPPILYILLSFLILDYSNYFWHRATHKLPILWRLHKIHHSDLGLDSSSVFRSHTIESVLNYLFKISVGVIFGIEISLVTYYEYLRMQISFFQHSNLFVPEHIDRILSKIIITPSIHINHHLADPNLANTNFGAILSVWDILHKTYPKRNYERNPTLGIPKYRDKKSLNFLRLIFIIPFIKQDDSSKYYAYSKQE